MKIFFDMEFTGLHQNTTPISLGMIDENDNTFYAEFGDYDHLQINDWLRENVIENLCFHGDVEAKKGWCNTSFQPGYCESYGNREHIADSVHKWLAQYDHVEMWSDCLAYDWVLFNQLWGHAFNIPENIYYIPFDLSSMLKVYGYNPDLDRKLFSEMNSETKHNALSDAKMIKACHDKILKEQAEKIYYVYGYYDLNGNLFYIGKGKDNRFLYHLYEFQNYRKDKTIYNRHKTNKIKSIIDKVGKDFFMRNCIKIIKDKLTDKEALHLEKTEILKHGKLIDNTGTLTNITDGGDYCIGHYHKSKEHRDKISNTLKGHTRSQDSKNKQSKTVSGKHNPNYDKQHTEESKIKISNATSKPIKFNRIGYKSITECARIHNVSRTTIMRWLKKE